LSDKNLTCRECGSEFVFTEGEQEFYQNRGLLNEPSRCGDCRSARRRSRNEAQGPKVMHSVVCASCGQDAEVPFQPRLGKPVFCNDCYATERAPR